LVQSGYSLKSDTIQRMGTPEPTPRELTELRLLALKRHSRVQLSAAFGSQLEAHYSKVLDSDRQATSVRSLRRGSRLIAAIIVTPSPSGSFGLPATQIEILWQRRFLSASTWIANHLPTPSNLELMLDAGNASLIPLLVDAGLHVDLQIAEGSPRTALRRSSRDPVPAELEVVAAPMTNRDQADVAIEIQRHEMSTNPRYSWFAANSDYLERRQEDLYASITAPNARNWLLMSEGQIGGLASSSLRDPDPLWGSSVRTEIFLSPWLQGRGLTPAIYKMLHQNLVSQGVRSIIGGSSHPAMLHLYRQWGRRPFAYLLRSGREHTPWRELVSS
jgi:L-amino acid N-acyltransferase YncA